MSSEFRCANCLGFYIESERMPIQSTGFDEVDICIYCYEVVYVPNLKQAEEDAVNRFMKRCFKENEEI